jgi:hypothetical protein
MAEKLNKISFENTAEFKYIVSTALNLNLVHKELQIRLKSTNACYNSGQTFLSSRLQSTNVKISCS